MEQKLKSTQARANQYWFVDGLMEIGGGITCLLLSVYFAILQYFPNSQNLLPLLFVFIFGAAYGLRLLMQNWREHSTYPRTGYVEPERGRLDRWLHVITILFTLVLLGFMLVTILRGIQTMAWFPAIGGVIFAFIFTMIAYRTQLLRFYFLAAFCLVLGLLLAISGVGDFWGAAILSLVTALVMLAFGTLTRISYLRSNPRPVE